MSRREVVTRMLPETAHGYLSIEVSLYWEDGWDAEQLARSVLWRHFYLRPPLAGSSDGDGVTTTKGGRVGEAA